MAVLESLLFDFFCQLTKIPAIDSVVGHGGFGLLVALIAHVDWSFWKNDCGDPKCAGSFFFQGVFSAKMACDHD